MTGLDCIAALKALGEETRLRILRLLFKEPLSVNEISARLKASQYNVSKHLRIMREAGLLEAEKQGKQRLYRVTPELKRAVAMAAGGLLNARKVADTMANKITDMNPGQGFAANLATAFLVNTASYHGLPVSTTHVSVGSLLGIGITTRQAKWRPVLGVLLSWVITLPCAAALSALSYLMLRPR